MPDASGSLPLYRPEAVAARRDAWLGQPRLLQPIPIWIAAAASLAAIALVISVLVFGEYTRRVRLTGSVVPSAGLTRVFAPQPGRILDSSVSEGSVVRRGDRLYTISLDSVTAAGETEAVVAGHLRAQRAELVDAVAQRTQLDANDKAGLRQQEQEMLREIDRIETQIAHTAEYAAILQGLSDKYRKLSEEHVVAAREFEIRQQNHMQTRQELEALQRQRIELDQKLAEIRTKLSGFDASAAMAVGDLRQRIAEIDQKLAAGEARRAIEVVAPRDGIVTAIVAQPGQMVAAGAPLLSVLPSDGRLEIELLAQSSAIGFVRTGTRVLLRYAAFPYQKFGQYPGMVTRISTATLRPGESETMLAAEDAKQPKPLYRITVGPDAETVTAYGKPEPLRAGMTVEADLLLDTRPLYQWLFEPLYSLRGSLAGMPAGGRP